MDDKARIAQLEAELATLRAELRDRAELERDAARFVGSFEHVFGHDWHYTKLCLRHVDTYVEPDHTFINPGHFDEGNNWCSRFGLLEAYRSLADTLARSGAYPYDVTGQDVR